MFSEAGNTVRSQKIKYWQAQRVLIRKISAPFPCFPRHRYKKPVAFFTPIFGKELDG